MRRFRTVFLIAVLIIVAAPATLLAHPLEIYILNVGQGDATLVIGPPPGRKTLLIDSGEEMSGSKSHYKNVAASIRELTKKSTLDYFVISHYHFDHIGTGKGDRGNGLFGLIQEERIKVRAIIDRGDVTKFGDETGPHKAYQTAVKQWRKDGRLGKRETARLGAGQIDLGSGVIVEIVAVNGNDVLRTINARDPSLFEDCPPSENDYSVALKITFGVFEYFTGGDLGGVDDKRRFGEKCTSYTDLETSIATRIGNVEVMKLNHHGSGWSSNELSLKTLAPEVMIATSGSGNTYKHPDREVMKRAAHYGVVLITGGVSETAWPEEQVDKHMVIVGDDIQIMVDRGGRTYEIQKKQLRGFSDDEEASGADRAHATEILTNRLFRSPDRH